MPVNEAEACLLAAAAIDHPHPLQTLASECSGRDSPAERLAWEGHATPQAQWSSETVNVLPGGS